MQEHVRPDGSTYHLVAYDPATGAAKRKATVQGYRDDSTWARGQAWALYGFTVAYRETGDERFLATARRTADYFVAHLPEDKVPYWDFQAPNIPAEPRDSSAAAIAASGLLELSRRETDGSRARGYLDVATAILRSLSSESYLAARTQSMAVLLHGTLHKPRGLFDTGLVFGDYYYLEALLRYRLVPPTTPALPVAAATASDDASNAANTLDGDLGTRWRASRPEGWICYDLGEVRTVSKVSIALARGDERATRLRFDTSTDGLAWSARARAISAATTLRPETFDLPDARARYVRVVGLGTSAGPDTGITEVSIH
jgi:unsaturated chondroitin disaccharide hydrolase